MNLNACSEFVIAIVVTNGESFYLLWIKSLETAPQTKFETKTKDNNKVQIQGDLLVGDPILSFIWLGFCLILR